MAPGLLRKMSQILLSSPLPTSTDIPRNILAFRTITKLLAKIQQDQSFQVSSECKLSPGSSEHQELLICNAFATISNMHNDVVAVVTKQIPMSRTWDILVTRNDVFGDKKPDIVEPQDPTIGDARILAEMDLVEDEALERFVDEYW
jgi:hypothetical protein